MAITETKTQTFKDYAPTISTAGVTKAYCDGIKLKISPEPAPEPKLTKTKVRNIIAEFADIEAANGYVEIARKHKVLPHQVKTLHREWLTSKTPPQKVVTPIKEV